ncbi:MAG: lipopolysaccharide biosynthesis protein [Nitrospirota bacterium]
MNSRLELKKIIQRALDLKAEAIWVFIGQFGTALAGLIGIKLLTNVLSPSEFGKLALANTIIALIGTNFFGPFGQGFMRFWSISKDSGTLSIFYSVTDRFNKNIFLLSFIPSMILVFIVYGVEGMQWTVLVMFSLFTGIITGLISLRASVFTAARQRRLTALLNIGSTLAKPILAVLAVLCLWRTVNIALLGYITASLILFVIAERLYRENTFKKSNQDKDIDTSAFAKLNREILSYSWPFILWGVFGWIHMSCDRWSLEAFFGSDVVGSFSVVSQLAIYPLIFGSGFFSILFAPIAFQKAGDLSNPAAVKSANEVLLVMTVLFILVTILIILIFKYYHQELILLISNKHFTQYSQLLPGLTISWAFFYIGQLLTQFGLVRNIPRVYIVPKILTASFAGIGTFYFASSKGPSGVVWGIGIAGFMYFCFCLLIALKINRK